MDAVFYFTFEDIYSFDKDPPPVLRSVGFYIENLHQPWSEITPHLSEAKSQLEDVYGIHDDCTSPSGVNAIGYTSYEVEDDQRDELIEKWRQAFLHICPGCQLSAVYDLPHHPMNTAMRYALNDAGILQYIKDAHEHQQAQKLRETLNAHITTPASTAAVKKI